MVTCRSPEKFGVVEKNRITTINFDRSYDIYDNTYTPISNTKLNIDIMNKALFEAKRFYQQ